MGFGKSEYAPEGCGGVDMAGLGISEWTAAVIRVSTLRRDLSFCFHWSLPGCLAVLAMYAQHNEDRKVTKKGDQEAETAMLGTALQTVYTYLHRLAR